LLVEEVISHLWLVQGLVPDVRAGERIWVGPHVGQGLLREQNLKISRRNSAFGTTARKGFVLSSKRYVASVNVTEEKIAGLSKKWVQDLHQNIVLYSTSSCADIIFIDCI
jgi:hypothetical protein